LSHSDAGRRRSESRTSGPGKRAARSSSTCSNVFHCTRRTVPLRSRRSGFASAARAPKSEAAACHPREHGRSRRASSSIRCTSCSEISSRSHLTIRASIDAPSSYCQNCEVKAGASWKEFKRKPWQRFRPCPPVLPGRLKRKLWCLFTLIAGKVPSPALSVVSATGFGADGLTPSETAALLCEIRMILGTSSWSLWRPPAERSSTSNGYTKRSTRGQPPPSLTAPTPVRNGSRGPGVLSAWKRRRGAGALSYRRACFSSTECAPCSAEFSPGSARVASLGPVPAQIRRRRKPGAWRGLLVITGAA
jgi:hypothetical protein